MSPSKLAFVAEVRCATLLCGLNEMKGNKVESDKSNNSAFPFSPLLWKGLLGPSVQLSVFKASSQLFCGLPQTEERNHCSAK